MIPSLILKALAAPERPFVVWGSGNQYRDFVYVEDVVFGLIQLIDRGGIDDVIQLCSGHATTVRDLAEVVRTVSGKKFNISFDIEKPEGDLGRIGTFEKAKEVIGWSPRFSLERGIAETYEWMRGASATS